MRKRLYEIISASKGNDRMSSVYDIFMMAVIIVSLVPLVFKQSFDAFEIIDKVCAGIFTVDYLLRWSTADYNSKSNALFVIWQKHSCAKCIPNSTGRAPLFFASMLIRIRSLMYNELLLGGQLRALRGSSIVPALNQSALLSK